MEPVYVNQFGQILQRGVIVGHANKSGSYTDRKVGVITGFDVRREYCSKDRVVAKVTWVATGRGDTNVIHVNNVKSPGVDLNKLFVLDPRNLDQDIVDAVIDVL